MGSPRSGNPSYFDSCLRVDTKKFVATTVFRRTHAAANVSDLYNRVAPRRRTLGTITTTDLLTLKALHKRRITSWPIGTRGPSQPHSAAVRQPYPSPLRLLLPSPCRLGLHPPTFLTVFPARGTVEQAIRAHVKDRPGLPPNPVPVAMRVRVG
jgi:hypothetical protein